MKANRTKAVSRTWRIALLVFALVVGIASSSFAQNVKPVVNRVAANNQPFSLNNHALPLTHEPDPFDMLVSSAASFDIDSPVEARAEFDPPTAPVGGKVVYRVIVTALDESLTVPDQLPSPKELGLHRGGRGQTYQRTGGMKLRPQTTVIYRTTVTNAGTFTVPAFDVMAYGKSVKVPEATLKVVPAGSVAESEPPTLLVDLPKEDFYVGQLLKIPVILPMGGPGGGIGALMQPHITGDFIFSEQVPSGIRIENVQFDGKSFMGCKQELYITPLRAGRLELIAQGHASVQRPNPKQPGAMTLDELLVDSEPVTLTVKPLPTEGVLPGFTGAVGHFEVDSPLVSPIELKAGEPLNVIVQIRGDGNLGRLIPPRLPQTREWESFPPVSETTSSASILQRGFAAFKYTLIPLSEKIKTTPEIPFSYFDPKENRYVAMNVPAVPISVQPGAPGFQSHLPPLESPPPDPEELHEKEPVFTGLLGRPGFIAGSMRPLQERSLFVAMQVAPAALIFGFWGWDRRRRYLEEHPEVILKRRARRGLRKQLHLARRAAARKDAAGFVLGASNALREACAPHSAANPDALVCADVLQELPEPKRNGPAAENVRRLFAAADALRFGGTVRENAELLSLKPEFEQLLAEMRMRL